MRTSIAAIALVTALGGCGGDQVTARFEVDIDEVETIRLVVYEEGSTPLSCDALAFTEIDADVLAQATVVDVTGDRGERVDLGDIPRQGRKLFFAEGLTANGTSVVAGCEELGPIDGDEVVDILVEPRLAFVPLGFLTITSGELSVDRLLVTDLAGTQRESDIHWTLIGPAAFEITGTIEQRDGTAAVTTMLPPQPGPLRLQVRARWAEPLDQSAVQEPQAIELDLQGATASQGVAAPLQVGTLGSQVGVMALVGPPGAETARLFCFSPDSFASSSSPEPMTDVGALTTVRDPGGGGKVLGASQSEFFQLACGSPVSSTPISIARPLAAITLPSCDPTVADPAVYLQSPTGVSALTPDGAPIPSFTNTPIVAPQVLAAAGGDLITAGCVNSVLETVPTILLAQQRQGSLAVAQLLAKTDVGTPEETTRVQAVASQVTAGSAFPATNPGPGGLQLGLITEEGPAIGHYDLQPVGASTLAIGEVTSDPTPSVVTALASGDIDGDQLNDVVALVAFGDNVQVFMSLARQDTDDRLRGFFPGPVGQRSAALRVFDINGDGVDDIVLLSEDSLTVLDMGE